jgi:uncharacterized protein (DUF1810 family)
MVDGDDPHDLSRFVQAQAEDYDQALSEIRAGRKRSHWMGDAKAAWRLASVVRGLDRSVTEGARQ